MDWPYITATANSDADGQRVKMSTNLKLSMALLAMFAVVLGVLLYSNRSESSPGSAGSAATSGTPVWRDSTHALSTAQDNKVVLVEFLDFECEACRAMYPTMERIRADYADRITFGVRYFPIPSHTNSNLAARVVESAARQNKFVEMYQRMYETQPQWGESRESQEPLFRSYAQELGLDMSTFDRDLNDPQVAQRVDQDFSDGIELGVQGTPTLFLNGQQMASMPTYEQLKAQIDAALSQ